MISAFTSEHPKPTLNLKASFATPTTATTAAYISAFQSWRSTCIKTATTSAATTNNVQCYHHTGNCGSSIHRWPACISSKQTFLAPVVNWGRGAIFEVFGRNEVSFLSFISSVSHLIRNSYLQSRYFDENFVTIFQFYPFYPIFHFVQFSNDKDSDHDGIT